MINISGLRFSKLTAIKFAFSKKKRHYWHFQCDCGKQKILCKTYVATGKTRSCGCLGRKYKEGMTDSKIYTAWQLMKDRCNNKNNKRYSLYGGRGIQVCQRWMDAFSNFLEDMGEPPSLKHSLDRIDNNLDYSPSNCRWATNYQQTRNQRSNLRIELNNEVKCLSEWCEERKLNYSTTYTRIFKLGWSHAKALQ